MINYIDNMSFQKKNFPEIFNSYKFPGNRKSNTIFQVKETLYLYFLMNDECSLMMHINKCFGVDFKCDFPISIVIISFGYENQVIGFDNQIAKVSLNHPYLKVNYPIVFANTDHLDFLEKSCDFYSFVDKPLKQMSELRIRKYFQEYHFETHNISTYEKVLNLIYCKKPKYTFLQKKMNCNQEINLKDAEHWDKYSLLLISIINDALMLKEDEIIQSCVKGVMSNFSIRGNEIIEKHLQIGEFESNFIIIEKYIQFKKQLKQEVNSYFKDTLIFSIRNYKKISNNHTAVHNMISDDNKILGVDDYMNDKIEELNKLLEAF